MVYLHFAQLFKACIIIRIEASSLELPPTSINNRSGRVQIDNHSKKRIMNYEPRPNVGAGF
jgi:hypothetical protein